MLIKLQNLKTLDILYPRISTPLTTNPYEKCIVAYKKLTSTYDVFRVLANDHDHVCLCNPLVMPKPYFFQRLCIEKGQPDVPHHGGCHHHMDVCIGGIPGHVPEPGKEAEGSR